MKITHIMLDGTVRDSIEGVVIQSEQFYQVLHGIKERGVKNQARKKTNQRATKTDGQVET